MNILFSPERVFHGWLVPSFHRRKSETKTNNLNSDLKEISKWTFQGKTSFNPDPSKQAQEFIFSRETTKKSS